jgi:hypothetical protein
VPQDDLANIVLGPDDEPPKRVRKTTRRQVNRLQPLPGPYVRVPIQWLCKPGREHIAPPEMRLFLYVLYRSHWGQRGVVLTNAAASEVGVEPRTKQKALGRLKRKGWVRTERHSSHKAPLVWPIVLTA